MAVAAEIRPETWESHHQSQFDWSIDEIPYAAEMPIVYSPESEVYGRSLTTIRRLGAYMIGKSAPEIISSPEAAQAKVEFYTSVEEGFGTDMELGGGFEVRDFDIRPVINGHVMSKDLKTSIASMTENGVKCAVETARHDDRFLPQLTRSKWDNHNALIVDQMTRGETNYNTRIVISPFPEEGAAQSGNEYWRDIGYVPHLKRGFVQLYHVTGEGVTSGSLSFDGSDKQRLREVFEQQGVTIPPDEVTDNWLHYAITGDFSEEQAMSLATELADTAGDPTYKKSTNTVDVTQRYRPVMERAFNESYIHICESLFSGRQTEGARSLIYQLADKADNFNHRYATALYGMRADANRFTNDDSTVLHELLVYSTIEMMRALHLQNGPSSNTVTEGTYSAVAQLQSTNSAQFQDVLGGFGAEGARSNRTYSACGLSISLGESKGVNDVENPQAAFGGQDSKGKDDDKYGSLEFKCPKCKLTNTRPRGKLIPNCQHCRADVRC